MSIFMYPMSLLCIKRRKFSLAVEDVHRRSPGNVQQGAPLRGLDGVQKNGQLVFQLLHCVFNFLWRIIGDMLM